MILFNILIQKREQPRTEEVLYVAEILDNTRDLLFQSYERSIEFLELSANDGGVSVRGDD